MMNRFICLSEEYSWDKILENSKPNEFLKLAVKGK